MPNIPRGEHPRPQMTRESWLSLNGEWSYRISWMPILQGGVLRAPHRRWSEKPPEGPYPDKITVPYAPESKLSGVEYPDFIDHIDYHRKFTIPSQWKERRIFLRFGGIDFHADVYVNGTRAGSHSGGSSPFKIDITRFAVPGAEADLNIAVRDFISSGDQGGGKQTHYAKSCGCFYTRTTGIWQTVWVEAVRPGGIEDTQYFPDAESGGVTIVPQFLLPEGDGEFIIRLRADIDSENVVSEVRGACRNGRPYRLTVPNPELWMPGSPKLYGLDLLVVRKGEEIDRVRSYFGLRDVSCRSGKVCLNGEPVFLRFVLDQGFYPDGVWTAPSDQDLKRDIELSMAAGFNGARLHQKVFEDRFHYWADRLGYLTWAEWPSWGFDYNDYKAARTFMSEVSETVAYLRNHPSIIGWTPHNETWDFINPRAHELNHDDAYRLCKAADPTRPVNGASGSIHHLTDLYTAHLYDGDGEVLAEKLGSAEDPFRNLADVSAPVEGQPYIVDEFGGIRWTGKQEDGSGNSWGYGDTPETEDGFFRRLHSLIDVLNSREFVAGWCYTQLTDVEQEQNGVYYYSRKPKFPAERLRECFSKNPPGYK
ncbi:MAG: glycoside hydrolase family 2 protein [Spirochaetia bacterium]